VKTAELKELARAVAEMAAPLLAQQVRDLVAPGEKYARGYRAIATHLGISEDTVRRRGFVVSKSFRPGTTKRIPVCSTESTGKRARPVALVADLKRYREFLNQ
jgi:hypothetical protein